jgi:hypothetical protein
MRERAAIVSALVPPSRLYKARKSTPPRARRMRDDRIRPTVAERVALFVPRVDSFKPEV